jgi:hypothetical protein
MKTVAVSKRIERRDVLTWVSILVLLAVLLALPEVALAQGLPEKPRTLLNEIALYAVGLGASIVTICGVIGFSRMAANKAQWADLTPIMWGGAGIGAIAMLAAYITAP